MKKTVLISFTILCLLSTVFLMGLTFNIKTIKAGGTIYIRADGSIDPPMASISSLDNIMYTFTDNIYDSIVIERNNMILDGAGYTLQGAGSGCGINLLGRNNVTVKNTEIKEFSQGIVLSFESSPSSNLDICQNIIPNNDGGPGITGSSLSNSSISGNTITNNNYGIILRYYSFNNVIAGNNITANLWEGLTFFSCMHNTVSENHMASNEYGMWIQNSYSNVISGNNMTANTSNAILIGGDSSNNTISGNYIADAEYGLCLSASNNSVFGNTLMTNKGIWLSGASNNHIYHNTFHNNHEQVYDIAWYHPEKEPSVNTWDNGYPSGGNYWSNYTGVDSDPDGIGDIKYVIDANNTDYYPLMGTFSNFKATSKYHVQTICNSSISDFEFNMTTISFNVLGENGTTGFCRICIPTALMADTYTVFVNGTEVPHALLPCSNSTHSFLYFTYQHSTHEVVIQGLDTALPTISVLSPENKTYSVDGVSLTFTVSESTSWFGYSLDGQANVTITGNKTLSDLSDGLHDLIVYANDTAGNMGASEMVYFTIEIQQEEAFPIEIAAVIVIIGVAGAVVFIYFTKFKK